MLHRSFAGRDIWNTLRNLERAFDTMVASTLDEFQALPSGSSARRLLPGGASATDVASTKSTTPAAFWPSFTGAFFPAVECFTRDNQLVVRAELPGVQPEDVEVIVAGDQLTLRGEKKARHQSEQGDVLFQEVAHGQFSRTFSLPQGVKADQVTARFENGVLEVTMPGEGLPVTRKVPVELGEGPGKKSIKAA